MEVSVEGKVALVTGGSRGIGLATALEFANSGAVGVAVTSRKEENVEAAASELVAAGVAPDRILTMAARADSEESASSAVAATVERFGSVDILVNNAGTSVGIGMLMEVDLGGLDKTWSVNLPAPLLRCSGSAQRTKCGWGNMVVRWSTSRPSLVYSQALSWVRITSPRQA